MKEGAVSVVSAVIRHSEVFERVEMSEADNSRAPWEHEPSWEPINELLASATAGVHRFAVLSSLLRSEMTIGEMITTQNFSLHDAMSSIEASHPPLPPSRDRAPPQLMDPHMDAGMEPAKPLLTFERLPDKLSGAELLDIIDRLTATQVAWYEGCPLTQTLFTCLYLHDQCSSIQDEVLHAFAVCLLKSCDLARETIIAGDIYEEEDYAIEPDDFNMLREVEPAVVLKEAQAVEQRLGARIKALRAAIKSGATQVDESTAMVPAMSDVSLEDDLRCCELLQASLTLRRAYLTAITHLKKPQCKGLKPAAKSFNFAMQQLETVWEARCGGVAETGAAAEGGNDTDLPPGFDLGLNRRLLGPSPPRTVATPTTRYAYSKLREHMEHMCDACTIEGYGELESLQRYMKEFSDRGADIVARSWVKVLVVSEWKVFGKHPLQIFIWDKIRSTFGLPDSVLNVGEVEPLLVAITKVIHQSWRILCLNPGRQHRSLAISLRDWAVLQQQAELVDQCVTVQFSQQPQPPPPHTFSHWVFRQMLSATIMHARRGIELQLHYPRELQIVMWFLDHFLQLDSHVEAAVREVSAVTTPAPDKAKSTKKKSGKDKKQEKKAPKATPEQNLRDAQRLLLQCTFWLVTVLKFGRAEDGKQSFGSMQTRFDRRFGESFIIIIIIIIY